MSHDHLTPFDVDALDVRVMRQLHILQTGIDRPVEISRSAFGDRVAFADEPDFRLAHAIENVAGFIGAALAVMMLYGVVAAIAGGRL